MTYQLFFPTILLQEVEEVMVEVVVMEGTATTMDLVEMVCVWLL